jgi:TPR repeat protein
MAASSSNNRATQTPPSLEDVARLARLAGGDKDAQAALGNLYLQGDGVERNLELAVSWIRKAADQGSAPGHYLLAKCYAAGVGVAKDVRQARKHYRASAAAGYPAAVSCMKRLTTCFACGAENTHRVCARCVGVSFCDTQCQSRCWPHPHQAASQASVRRLEASLGVDHGEAQH